MNKRLSKGAVIIGKTKITNERYFQQPKKKYRITIQERSTKTSKLEKSRSFMIYDFVGRSNIDFIVRKLKKLFK